MSPSRKNRPESENSGFIERSLFIAAAVMSGVLDLEQICQLSRRSRTVIARTILSRSFVPFISGIEGIPTAQLTEPFRCRHCKIKATVIPCIVCASQGVFDHYLITDDILQSLQDQARHIITKEKGVSSCLSLAAAKASPSTSPSATP